MTKIQNHPKWKSFLHTLQLIIGVYIFAAFTERARTVIILTSDPDNSLTKGYLLYTWVKYFFTAVVAVYTLLNSSNLVPIHLIHIKIRLKREERDTQMIIQREKKTPRVFSQMDYLQQLKNDIIIMI